MRPHVRRSARSAAFFGRISGPAIPTRKRWGPARQGACIKKKTAARALQMIMRVCLPDGCLGLLWG
eukprot:6187946-Pyramimonas_sp.AAC.1